MLLTFRLRVGLPIGRNRFGTRPCPLHPRAACTGDAICRVGDDTGGVFGVHEGSVEIHVQGRSNGQTLGLIAGPGFWIGDMAALTGQQATCAKAPHR